MTVILRHVVEAEQDNAAKLSLGPAAGATC